MRTEFIDSERISYVSDTLHYETKNPNLIGSLGPKSWHDFNETSKNKSF